MIGYNHLGRNGRLGNQMFQYAALRGIAAHHGYDWCIPPSDFIDEHKDHQLLEAFKLPKLKNIELFGATYLEENSFTFSSKIFIFFLLGRRGHDIYIYMCAYLLYSFFCLFPFIIRRP